MSPGRPNTPADPGLSGSVWVGHAVFKTHPPPLIPQSILLTRVLAGIITTHVFLTPGRLCSFFIPSNPYSVSKVPLADTPKLVKLDKFCLLGMYGFWGFGWRKKNFKTFVNWTRERKHSIITMRSSPMTPNPKATVLLKSEETTSRKCRCWLSTHRVCLTWAEDRLILVIRSAPSLYVTKKAGRWQYITQLVTM